MLATNGRRPRPRVPGWRGWLDDREHLLRLIEGRREPLWARVYWGWHRWYLVVRLRWRCWLVGHPPLAWSRYLGTYCPRCGLAEDDEEWFPRGLLRIGPSAALAAKRKRGEEP